MDVVINEELKAYIDPLTAEEREALERSLLAEGCRDALVLWGDMLVDGHNRHEICSRHGLPFRTVQNPRFQSIEDVHLWMIDQHLGRRSVSDFQRGVLALRKREIVASRRARTAAGAPADVAQAPAPATAPDATAGAAARAAAVSDSQHALDTREALARAARLSSSQVVMIEKIQKHATPEVVAAVKAGELSINAAAAVASLPADEQAAAAAGGTDELKEAARRVRLSRRKSAAPADPAVAPGDDTTATAAEALPDDVPALRQRVRELSAENAALRAQVAQLESQLRAASPH
jgi:hypothetical protein